MRNALAALPLDVSRETRRAFREGLTDDLTLAEGPLGAWKHAAAIYDPAFAENDVYVLAAVKSPGAWLTSMFRRPYHRLGSLERGSLASFAAAPWICVRRELTPPVVPNIVELWNLKVASYLKFEKAARPSGVRCLVVRAEDLILDQSATLGRVFDWLGIDPVAPIPEITADTKHKGRTLDDMKRYYGDELWRKEIDDATGDILSRHANRDLLARFGYTL